MSRFSQSDTDFLCGLVVQVGRKDTVKQHLWQQRHTALPKTMAPAVAAEPAEEREGGASHSVVSFSTVGFLLGSDCETRGQTSPGAGAACASSASRSTKELGMIIIV